MRPLLLLLLIASILGACSSEDSKSPEASNNRSTIEKEQKKLPPIVCDGSPILSLAEYINDFKGKDIFEVNDGIFQPTGAAIALGKLRFVNPKVAQEANTLSYSFHYSNAKTDSKAKLIYLLLERDGCPLLLEAFQYDSVTTKSKTRSMIRLAMWQKSSGEWEKLSPDYFPWEALGERVAKLSGDSLKVREKNKAIFILSDAKHELSTIDESLIPLLAFDSKKLTTLVWRDGAFQFLLSDKELNRIYAVNHSCEGPISTTYLGLMGKDRVVELRMDLEQTNQQGQTNFAGELNVRGKASYLVRGQLLPRNQYDKKELKIELYKNNKAVFSLEGYLQGSSSTLNLLPKGEQFGSSDHFVLAQKDLLAQSLQPKKAVEVCDYANEILKTNQLFAQSEYVHNKELTWNNPNYDDCYKKEDNYQNKRLFDYIKNITKINERHFIYTIESEEDLEGFGFDGYFEGLELKGAVHYIQLEAKKTTILELGCFNSRHIEDDRELICDTEYNSFAVEESRIYLRISERSPEGLWRDISSEVLPAEQEILAALKFHYPTIAIKNAELYGSFDNVEEEEWQQLFDPYESYSSYNFYIIETDNNPEAIRSTFQHIQWKNNSLFLDKNGGQLKWKGQQFDLITEADTDVPILCFDGYKMEEERGYERFKYLGTIGKKQQIKMELAFGNQDGEDYVEGEYWTAQNKQRIPVEGLYNPSTKAIHINRLKAGRIVEIFSGTIAPNCQINGIWKQGDRELPFSLQQK